MDQPNKYFIDFFKFIIKFCEISERERKWRNSFKLAASFPKFGYLSHLNGHDSDSEQQFTYRICVVKKLLQEHKHLLYSI